MKKFLPLIILFIVLIPVFVNAQTPPEPPIIPDCGDTAGKFPPCGYQHLLRLVNNIINWIIKISVPVAAGVFAWAGIKYMTTGISDQKSEAKAMLRKVLFGFVFILAAWIIVTTITNALLSPKFPKEAIPVEGVK